MMGLLTYGSNGVEIEFEDRLLAHLQVVISSKLRRGEGFTLGFCSNDGRGPRALWIGQGIPLMYQYGGTRPPTLNTRWLNDMVARAGTSNGLLIAPEPEPDPDPESGS
ncbi:DUF7882 family protein [Herbiconiux sp. YIM B11900]|uniref:DUF7882 family protein n=1 Tax=Herbiconiux sp. YIM B11900 TaxID=3404131 RepID=UPI003F83EECF